MASCVIVGGGDFAPALFPKNRKDFFVIAADAGYDHLKSAGVTPDLAVGDFDSLGRVPSDCPALRLPVMKNDTDLIAAAEEGIARGYRDFLIFGALGGRRFSHSLAAVQTLAWLLDRGASGELIGPDCRVSALRDGRADYPSGETGEISVFALGGEVTVTETGLLYPLHRARLTNSYPLGVSNSFTGAPASVTAEGGTVIIVREP